MLPRGYGIRAKVGAEAGAGGLLFRIVDIIASRLWIETVFLLCTVFL